MNTARKHKIETVKQLVYSTDKKLTAGEAAFLKQHGHKKQAYMFVHTEDDKQKAEGILKRIQDAETFVMLVSKEDMKL